MAFPFDFTADFFTLDNLQPLTLRAAGQPDQAIAKALNEPVEWSDPDKAAGQVVEADQLWVWPAAFTPARPPLGSLLIDQWGTAYTILSVKRVKAVNCSGGPRAQPPTRLQSEQHRPGLEGHLYQEPRWRGRGNVYRHPGEYPRPLPAGYARRQDP